MAEPLEPLPDDVRALLDQERRLALDEAASWQPPPGMMERVAARLPLDGTAVVSATSSLLKTSSWVMGGVVAGTLGGWMGHSWWVQDTPLPAVAPVVVLVPMAVETPPAVVTPEPVPAPRPPTRKKPVETPPPVDTAAERALLERARSALARREPALAMDAVEEHRRRFPSSQLAEERDALGILSLAADGKMDAARAALDAFKKQHPQSAMLPALQKIGR
jgi:hypothetical protein